MKLILIKNAINIINSKNKFIINNEINKIIATFTKYNNK